MKNPPVKSTRRAPRRRNEAPIDVEPIDAQPVRGHGPFVSFHYTYTEITAGSGGTHVRRRTTRLEDGKLSSESFEGTLERGAYDTVVRDTQRAFLAQQSAFLRMFTSLLPLSPFGRAKAREEE